MTEHDLDAEVEGDEAKSIDVQIAEAEAAGDWSAAIRLKVGRMAEAQTAEPRGMDEETQIRVAELEQSGDWMGAAQAKVAATQPQAPTIPEDVAAQIKSLEDEGKWLEAGKLKVQLIGLPL